MESPKHRAGFVNILGNPNVGKSTLMNGLVGEKLSIVTQKIQTTRHRIKGIVNGEDFQIVYSDLPGILNPTYQMQQKMMDFVRESLKDADIILYLIEPEETKYNEDILKVLQCANIPIFLIINKIDKSNKEQIAICRNFWSALLPAAEIIEISALEKINLEFLFDRIVSQLPESSPYFPKDALTDRPVRFFVSELIREQILLQFQKEIPYSVEVVVESFKEEENIIRIGVTLYVERETQRAIIIGKQGSAIKRLGIEARKEIEAFVEKHIYLDLSVKVLKDWRNSERLVKKFGY